MTTRKNPMSNGLLANIFSTAEGEVEHSGVTPKTYVKQVLLTPAYIPLLQDIFGDMDPETLAFNNGYSVVHHIIEKCPEIESGFSKMSIDADDIKNGTYNAFNSYSEKKCKTKGLVSIPYIRKGIPVGKNTETGEYFNIELLAGIHTDLVESDPENPGEAEEDDN